MPEMKRSGLPQKIYSYLQRSYQWYLRTPERSLDEAYQAALLIKAMEDENFNGKKIAPESADYGPSAMAYFQAELKKYLKIARMRLVEFRASQSWVGGANQTITKISRPDARNSNKVSFAIEARNGPSFVLEKLRFIDEVVSKYTSDDTTLLSIVKPPTKSSQQQLVDVDSTNLVSSPKKGGDELDEDNSLTEETNILPRSLLNTINRIRVELDPNSEQKVIQNFRGSQKKTVVAIRVLLLLIIIPLLTYQLSKNFIVGPIITNFGGSINETATFLNFDMEKEALEELQLFKERLEFQNLIGEVPKFSEAEIEKQTKERAREIAEEYRGSSDNAIENILADLLSLAAFGWIVYVSKREIVILKSFIDDIVYGLSDSAKAFIIILFTDMFVGFHSPEGWEVLLSSTSRHFGLPENHNFINLFIATFPVILDTVFKYWIFRYLNRISPSAVATYRGMNE